MPTIFLNPLTASKISKEIKVAFTHALRTKKLKKEKKILLASYIK